MPKPTMDELWEKKGNFVDTENGAVIPQPEDGFPIIAGNWPSRFVGARQARCSICSGFCAMSSNGIKLHNECPDLRPIWCPECAEFMLAITRAAEGRADI
jgi:hypothetical protein